MVHQVVRQSDLDERHEEADGRIDDHPHSQMPQEAGATTPRSKSPNKFSTMMGIVTATNVSQKNGRISFALRRKAATGPVPSTMTTGPTTLSKVMATTPGTMNNTKPATFIVKARMSATISADIRNSNEQLPETLRLMTVLILAHRAVEHTGKEGRSEAIGRALNARAASAKVIARSCCFVPLVLEHQVEERHLTQRP